MKRTRCHFLKTSVAAALAFTAVPLLPLDGRKRMPLSSAGGQEHPQGKRWPAASEIVAL